MAFSCCCWGSPGNAAASFLDLSAIRRLLEAKAARTFNRLVPSILERFLEKGSDGIYINKSINGAIQRTHELSSKQAQNVGKRWTNAPQSVGKQVFIFSHIRGIADTVELPKKNKGDIILRVAPMRKRC
jgi:hypothetical protein